MIISQYPIIYFLPRTRLIGVAALTAALNSDALYNDIRNFGIQVATIIRPILAVLFETPISILDDQYVMCCLGAVPKLYLAKYIDNIEHAQSKIRLPRHT